MFITKPDLYQSIHQSELEEIVRDDDAIITQAISSAIATMKVYLNDSYDTDAIFGATGTDRHALLITFCADISIWYLVAKGQPGQNYDDRKARHDRAISWLKAVQKTEMYADLARRETSQQKTIIYGSKDKRNNYY